MKIYLVQPESQKTIKRKSFKDMKCLQRLVIPAIFIFTLILIVPNICKLKAAKEADEKTSVQYRNAYSNMEYQSKCEINYTENKIVCTAATISEIQNFCRTKIKDRTKALKLEIVSCLGEVSPKDWTSLDTNIAEIIITRGEITEFTNSTFFGLSNLQKLHIFNDLMYKSKNLLSTLTSSINNFKFEGKLTFAENDPKNLLADNAFSLSNLKIIEFRNNNFASFINELTFKNIKTLRSLYCISTKLTSIHAQAFAHNLELELLDLTDNLLINIPTTLFENISKKIYRIGFDKNKFVCDCNLSYLIDFYKKNYIKFSHKLYCSKPEMLNGKEINKTELSCDSNKNCVCWDPDNDNHNILTSTATSIISTSTTPPNHDDNLVNVTCEDKNCNDCNDDSSPFLKIKEADVSFSVKTISNTEVQVILDKLIENLDIIWFNRTVAGQMKIERDRFSSRTGHEVVSKLNDFKTGCELDLNKTVVINGLNENSSYVFCLIKRNNTEISPFNCQSHYMSKIEQKLPEMCDMNPLTFYLLIAGVIFSAIIGAILMFYLIKYKPTLLRGSPRVVIINKGSKGVMVIPKPKRKISDEKSNKRSGSEKSTSTQYTNRSSYSEVKPQRRLSDSSIITGRSYIVPNIYEAVQYQKNTETDQTDIYFEKFPCSPPPPLPERTSKNSDKSEAIYAYPVRRGNYKH